MAITIRAHHVWSIGEARADEIQGVDGDALSALDVSAYRRLIVLLEDTVADLESRAAKVYRKPLANADARLRRDRGRWALDCEARARRACQRAEMARKDNEDA